MPVADESHIDDSSDVEQQDSCTGERSKLLVPVGLGIFIVSALLVAVTLCFVALAFVALEIVFGRHFFDLPAVETSDYVGVLLYFLAYFTIYFYAAYSWKYPITQLNRLRLYERKSMQIKPDGDKEVIPVRKSWFLDKDRYLRIRRNFLGMKMGYKPTNRKIDWLLWHLRCDIGRTNNYRKRLMQIDIDILTTMKKRACCRQAEVR